MAFTVEQLRARMADPDKQPGNAGVQLATRLLIVPVEPLIDHDQPE